MHKFICFSIPRTNWKHLDLQFWTFLSWTHINRPISFFTIFFFNTYTITRRQRNLCFVTVWHRQTWLWLRLTSGRNRCLGAQSSFRAQLHCVQSRSGASKVEHLCGHLNGIIWEAQNCPHTPKISYSCSALALALKAFSPPGWYRNADMWHYCSILSL